MAPPDRGGREYIMIGWAMLWGYVFWGNVPGPSTLIGVATTVAAGLYVLHDTIFLRRAEIRALYLGAPPTPCPKPS